MRHLAFASIAAVTLACGAPAKPSTVGNTAGPAANLAIKSGTYACGFYANDIFFGPYQCVVRDNTINKVANADGTGIPFSGTLAPAGAGVHLEAKLGCPFQAVCNVAFAVDLVPDADGTFKGKPHATGPADPDATWFLQGEFQLQRGGYGGDQYGGSVYGGGAAM